MIFMLFSTIIRPFLAANLLDPDKFSKTLSTLATDGLGATTLQVTNKETLYSFLQSFVRLNADMQFDISLSLQTVKPRISSVLSRTLI